VPDVDPDALRDRIDKTPLERRQVDLILVVPPGFQSQLQQGGRPSLLLLSRDKDDTSRLVNLRVRSILKRWKDDLKRVRLARAGLPEDFDDPVSLRDPLLDRPPARQEEESLVAVLVRFFPFILVLWALAGALYPAVDLCAGEKERGTMETLLVSPASREEIVWGKFLTIWVFSAVTALLNLLSMGFTAWQLSGAAGGAAFRLTALVWGVLLLLPLSAFFSAVCLAIGAYARSSKEGQHYLMPLFFVTMPLIFLTLAPGVELNPFYSMVPVTGVALLLQKLMAERAPDAALMLYFVPVLAPMILYSWLALRWAIYQFNREQVLFREAERLDLGLWLRHLWRDKEALPSAGQAFFCFGLILGLQWLSLNTGTRLNLTARSGISHLAFVATPPLFMALLLTTRPHLGLALRWPPAWAWPAAVLLAALVVPPLGELTLYILGKIPALKDLLEQSHQLPAELRALVRAESAGGARLHYFLVLAVLPAVCEELAFRGFILAGLRRSFRPWPAIGLSSFLFAVYHMNVFQVIPHFVLGVILALLVVRSGSVLPAVLFHLVYNSLLFAPVLLPEALGEVSRTLDRYARLRAGLAVGCAVLAGLLLAAVWRLGRPAEEAVPSTAPDPAAGR
jgi:sodium transport system permease protein